MDEFGVLTERYGLKPQRKSAPMAASKRSLNPTNGQSWHFGSSVVVDAKSTSYSSNVSWKAESVNGSLLDGDDIFFKSSSSHNKGVSSSDLNKSALNSFGNSNMSSGDELMYSNLGNSGTKASSSMNGYDVDDIFGSFSSPAKQNGDVDDLLGDFGQLGRNPKSWNQNKSGDSRKNAAEFDELVPGFGRSYQPSNVTRKSATAAEDPFVVLESTTASGHSSSAVFVDPLEEFAYSVSSKSGPKPMNSSQTLTKLKPPPKPTQKVEVKSSGMSSIDELEEFAMGRVRHSSSTSKIASKHKEAEDDGAKKQQSNVDDLDSFFSSGPRSSSVPKPRATAKASSKQDLNAARNVSNGSLSSVKKPAAPKNLLDDFSSLFGADPLFEEFKEIPGESEERRKARWDRERRTKHRVAQAVADMNQRDRRTQLEQEEKSRIAEALDADIKRWAAGKEGNMRALLSSLQIVLWPGCGWEPVSLTDLITSTSVKKVYRKATLYVHPDKVQQKGATLDQKYVAEKVFDVLKEAWNKFNKEELS